MNLIIEHEGNEIIHDFRKENLQWGWNIMGFDRIDKKTAKITCIGTGVKKGHCIATRQAGIIYVYDVIDIKYESNPRDFFNATLKICGTLEQ